MHSTGQMHTWGKMRAIFDPTIMIHGSSRINNDSITDPGIRIDNSTRTNADAIPKLNAGCNHGRSMNSVDQVMAELLESLAEIKSQGGIAQGNNHFGRLDMHRTQQNLCASHDRQLSNTSPLESRVIIQKPIYWHLPATQDICNNPTLRAGTKNVALHELLPMNSSIVACPG